jgi:hypothetical protein
MESGAPRSTRSSAGTSSKQTSQKWLPVLRRKSASKQESKRTKRWPANASLLSDAADPMGGDRRSANLEDHASIRLDQVAPTPDPTLAEVRGRLPGVGARPRSAPSRAGSRGTAFDQRSSKRPLVRQLCHGVVHPGGAGITHTIEVRDRQPVKRPDGADTVSRARAGAPRAPHAGPPTIEGRDTAIFTRRPGPSRLPSAAREPCPAWTSEPRQS